MIVNTHPHLEGTSNINNTDLLWYCMYVKSESTGKSLANRLREQGFDVVEDRLEDDGDRWLVRVEQIVPIEQASTESRKFFETMTAEHDAALNAREPDNV